MTDVATDVFGRATVPEGTDQAEPEDLSVALEAVCFSVNRALTISEASEILGASPTRIRDAADALSDQLRGRGLMVQRHQDELQMVTRPEFAWAVARALNPEKPARLSKAAVETLAIVAYRQPVTRAHIEAIRGVNCEAVVESLERRGLIVEMGRQDSPGQPRLWGTTLRFLQIVGLESIEALPSLPDGLEIPDIETDESWRSVVDAVEDGDEAVEGPSAPAAILGDDDDEAVEDPSSPVATVVED